MKLRLVASSAVFALLLAPGGRSGGGLGDVTDFSQMKRGRVGKKVSKITFEDAGGVDEAITELREVVGNESRHLYTLRIGRAGDQRELHYFLLGINELAIAGPGESGRLQQFFGMVQ